MFGTLLCASTISKKHYACNKHYFFHKDLKNMKLEYS